MNNAPYHALGGAGRTAGITLVELLVAMGLFTVVLTIAFNAFSSSNKLVEADTGRVMAGQNVQSSLDILAADVRQAGEDLSLDLRVSGLEFDTASKTVTVRRGLPNVQRLPLCAVSGSTVQVNGPPPGSSTTTPACAYQTPVTGVDPVNIAAWRSFFTSQAGRPQTALLFRPASGSQTFKVDPVIVTTVNPATTSGSGTSFVYRVSVSLNAPIPSGYSATNGSLLVLVDQRRYKVVDNNLVLALGGQTDAQAQVVAYNVTDLALAAALVNPVETLNSMTLSGPWSRIKSVSVTLTSGSPGQGRQRSRALTTTIFPRNVEQARGTGTGAP